MIRRELIKFAGGAATGAVFTPLPWRLLGDTAIWTQNWSWVPRNPRGETTETEGHCTLCPAGCAVKVRACQGVPYGVRPNGEPLCPAGLAGHTLIWHPLRLRQCLHQGRPAKLEDALEAAKAAAGHGVAVLDLLPGRTASLVHRLHLASIPGARYIPAPLPEGGTARAVAALMAKPAEIAVELASAKTVLSVGTPILDGWAAPARSGPNRGFTLWQADAWRSRTADLADTRLTIRPDSETALLLGLGRQLLASDSISRRARSLAGFEDYRQAVSRWTPPATAARTGVAEDRLLALAKALELRGPSAVIADGDPLGGPLPAAARAAAAALNALLGAPAFALRGQLPVPASWKLIEPSPLDQVPDGSIGLLVIDEPIPGLALPWQAIAPKLKPSGALVVALTWNRASYAQRAAWLVPVPVYLEAPADAPPAPDTATPRLALSPALLKPPEGAICAPDFVAALAGAGPGFAEQLQQRAKVAAEGNPPQPAPVQCARLLPQDSSAEAIRHAAEAGPGRFQAHGWRLASVSPFLGKLWQEWDLRPAPGEALAHPDSIQATGLAAAGVFQIESKAGRLPLRLKPDSNAPPGVIALHAGPAYAQLCEPAPDGAWRLKNPKVVRS